jgi:hypothetical protein
MATRRTRPDCARAVIGHAAAVPPSNVMNSRRLIRSSRSRSVRATITPLPTSSDRRHGLCGLPGQARQARYLQRARRGSRGGKLKPRHYQRFGQFSVSSRSAARKFDWRPTVPAAKSSDWPPQMAGKTTAAGRRYELDCAIEVPRLLGICDLNRYEQANIGTRSASSGEQDCFRRFGQAGGARNDNLLAAITSPRVRRLADAAVNSARQLRRI